MLILLQQLRGHNQQNRFNKFIQLFQIQKIAENIIKHLLDLPALQSLLFFATNLAAAGELSTWDLGSEHDPRDAIQRKIDNAERVCGIIYEAHYVPQGLLQPQPCHICDRLSGWNVNHISCHLEVEDMNIPRWQYTHQTQHTCNQCLHNIIQVPPPNYYDLTDDDLAM